MKKKCLIIIPGIPFPPVDGHKLKIYNFILILSKHFDLHIITISKENINSAQLQFVNEYSYQNKHFKLGVFGSIIRLLKSIFSSIPFQVNYFTLFGVKNYIREHTNQDDFVVFNLIRTCGYVNQLSDKFMILDMVDSLSNSYLKSRETTTSFLYRFIYGIEGNRLDKYEKESIAKINMTLFVNKEESLKLNSYGKVVWLPNGVNSSLFNYDKKCDDYRDYLVFFGTMFYQPNIDAVIWLDKYVLDYLDPNIKIVVIGARPSVSILNIARRRKNIKVTGFLDDPYFIINSCFAVIAPMQNGGGIQNKILETMSMGKINILTSYAADPIIGALNGKHFIVENDPLAMSKKINEVFFNPSSFIKMGQDAAKLIQSRYTWDAYEEKIISQLKEINNG